MTKTVLNEVGHLTLDINNCSIEGYDGAASVSDHIDCLSANILRINKKAVHTHNSHKLNLAVAASCSIQGITNVLDQIKLSFFFTFSEPCPKILKLSIENHTPDCLKKKLKNVCHTRWVEQIIVLGDFEGLFISISFVQSP